MLKAFIKYCVHNEDMNMGLPLMDDLQNQIIPSLIKVKMCINCEVFMRYYAHRDGLDSKV